MFGKRKQTGSTLLPEPSVGADGKRRVFGEADYARHGAMFRALGIGIDDPSNVIPDKADFDRMIAKSLADQEIRRQGIEADLLARHGCNAIRPFFLFSEGVYKGQVGDWLIKLMRLLPYDDWNVTYLPMDARTEAALKLPLHPQCSIPAFEKPIVARLTAHMQSFHEAQQLSLRQFEKTANIEILAGFNAGVDRMRAGILEMAGQMTPLVIQMIANVRAGR